MNIDADAHSIRFRLLVVIYHSAQNPLAAFIEDNLQTAVARSHVDANEACSSRYCMKVIQPFEARYEVVPALAGSRESPVPSLAVSGCFGSFIQLCPLA